MMASSRLTLLVLGHHSQKQIKSRNKITDSRTRLLRLTLNTTIQLSTTTLACRKEYLSLPSMLTITVTLGTTTNIIKSAYSSNPTVTPVGRAVTF